MPVNSRITHADVFLINFSSNVTQMGSRRFGAFIVYTSVLSTFLELVVFNLFFDIERYSGPYPQLGAVLALYHTFTPRLHPKFYGVLGYDFSEKSLTYGLCAQVLLSGGLSTIVPMAVGFLSGTLSVNLSENELPELVYSFGQSIGKSFADEGESSSSNMPATTLSSYTFANGSPAIFINPLHLSPCSTCSNDVADSSTRSRKGQ